MTGHKKSTIERQSLSEVKTGRGSVVGKKWQFKHNDPQHKVVKTLNSGGAHIFHEISHLMGVFLRSFVNKILVSEVCI